MENNENFVTEEKVAENVEQTTEQTPKTYTEAEFNAKLDEVLGKKIARREAKIRKEYDKKYGELEDVLKAGTGKESVEEVTDALKQFYESKGVKMPTKPNYTDNDLEILANADAEEIIRSGDDEVAYEVARLANIGVDKMSAREKALFRTLAEHRQNSERRRELSSLGYTEDIYESQDFKDFAGKFNSNTPIKDIMEIYSKTQPKKEIRTMGSMKNTDNKDSGVKDYYSPEEAKRFSQKEINENPALFKAIENSMRKWR